MNRNNYYNHILLFLIFIIISKFNLNFNYILIYADFSNVDISEFILNCSSIYFCAFAILFLNFKFALSNFLDIPSDKVLNLLGKNLEILFYFKFF